MLFLVPICYISYVIYCGPDLGKSRQAGKYNCDANASCANTDGTYTCNYSSGQSGNGTYKGN